jgi:hypothetical protein
VGPHERFLIKGMLERKCNAERNASACKKKPSFISAVLLNFHKKYYPYQM